MRGIHWRLGVLLVVATSLLVLPALEVSGAPPTAAVTHSNVPLVAADADTHTATVDVGDVVAVNVVLDGRHIDIRWADDGGFGPWQHVYGSTEHAPDPGSDEAQEARTDLSEPIWIGDADRLQIRADRPGHVTLELVHMHGDRDYEATSHVTDSAEAFAVWPPIIPRYRWDPNRDCQPDRTPGLASGARRIYIHHTVVFPHYGEHEGDDVVRAICLGHVNKRGFSDIGYNFLIDAYGRIYQGRVGGILQPVIGAHASGFNRGSIGIALVGDFDEHAVPAAAVSALDQLVAWLSDLHGIEPYAMSEHVSTGGETTRFAEGQVIELPSIVGHRDTGLDTACPGDHLYDFVRGKRPMAQRVRAILESSYGWAPTSLPPPPAGEPKVVAPSAGDDHDHDEDGDGHLAASVGQLVGEISGAVREPDPVRAVRSIVRGASVATELVTPDPPGTD